MKVQDMSMQSLEFLRHLNPIETVRTNYLWNEKWISSFESPWSVIEKFRKVNAASIKDVFSIFGTDQTKTKIGNWSKAERSLYTMVGLDKDRLKTILQIPLKEWNEQYLSQLFNLFPIPKNEIDSYVRETLYYCLECMRVGHHSLYHQCIFITKCPYHQINLLSQCIKCYKQIPYNLSDTWNVSAYICKCGHPLIEQKDFLRLTEDWDHNQFKITSLDLKKLLTLSDMEKERMNRMYIHPLILDKYANEFIPNLIDTFSPDLRKRVSEKHFFVKSVSELSKKKSIKSKSFKLPDAEIQYLYKELYISSKQTMRSVFRHVLLMFHNVRRLTVYCAHNLTNSMTENEREARYPPYSPFKFKHQSNTTPLGVNKTAFLRP